MSAREHLAWAVRHGLSVPASVVEDIVEECLAGIGPEWGTTAEVARVVGRYPEYWQDLARTGKLSGAYQEHDGGPWTLPLAECRAHLARLSHELTPARRRRRGPWKETEAEGAQAA